MMQTGHDSPAPAGMSPSAMRTITYLRHECQAEPEIRTATLPVFVYDIPYVGACGIFPPFHHLNRLFESGGAEGGMGPGATWRPFAISEEEYAALVNAIAALDPTHLKERARFGRVKFAFDEALSAEPRWETWVQRVCDRHREAWHKKIKGGELPLALSP